MPLIVMSLGPGGQASERNIVSYTPEPEHICSRKRRIVTEKAMSKILFTQGITSLNKFLSIKDFRSHLSTEPMEQGI